MPCRAGGRHATLNVRPVPSRARSAGGRDGGSHRGPEPVQCQSANRVRAGRQQRSAAPGMCCRTSGLRWGPHSDVTPSDAEPTSEIRTVRGGAPLDVSGSRAQVAAPDARRRAGPAGRHAHPAQRPEEQARRPVVRVCRAARLRQDHHRPHPGARAQLRRRAPRPRRAACASPASRSPRGATSTCSRSTRPRTPASTTCAR